MKELLWPLWFLYYCVIDLHRVKTGYRHFLETGENSDRSYQSLIRLFCSTSGRSNDWMSRDISRRNPPRKFSTSKGILGDLTEADLSKITQNLDTKGFHIFQARLPQELCRQLLDYSTTQAGLMRPMDGEKESRVELAVYDRRAPRSVRYDFTQAMLLESPQVQSILADTSVLSVAQSYLRALPVADVLAMWWHTAFSKVPDAEAAQFYHFDMDRVKWLKFFIYLTDTSNVNGPHCFISGSHRTRGMPWAIRKRGAAFRFTDEEVAEHYSSQKFIEFNAPAGTIIAEDTRGLHKGKHVLSGDRLMLQFQFSNSLFGKDCPKTPIGKVVDQNLKNRIAEYPRIYSCFT